MSRHRRQASHVLQPEIISSDELVGITDFNKAVGAGVSGQDAAGGIAGSGSSSTDKSTVPPPNKQDSPVAPGKKPPAGKSSAT
ncbi:hypothetical protein Vadar_006323 [Vaccinium darrowii]|uniref:Uncharacterized protein n=1 Tax=Vaccinium darrowii TaxID=229202 RepID=A0ACB7X7X9_9ERIC|nr:hypothetical protein Vadar_006323 [Vaccinium darrowii]